MDDAVHDSTCADNEGHHGDGKPDVGLEEDDSDVFEGGDQDQHDHQEEDVLLEDHGEGEHQLHRHVQTLVHVVNYCLSIVHLVRSDKPSVFFLIEFFSFQSLLFLERDSDVGNGFEVVSHEDGLGGGREVQDTIEHSLGDGVHLLSERVNC